METAQVKAVVTVKDLTRSITLRLKGEFENLVMPHFFGSSHGQGDGFEYEDSNQVGEGTYFAFCFGNGFGYGNIYGTGHGDGYGGTKNSNSI